MSKLLIKEIKIANKKIGDGHSPFIVAEMSGNHNQSLSRALDIVKVAAKAGVQAVKLQTYTADTMTLKLDKGDFFIKDSNSLWKGTSLYKLYQQAYTPWKWHKPIFDLCEKLGIIGFSTPFDETAVDFLESLNVPCYKIASFENVHFPLLHKVAATGKPMIISTGMTTLKELKEIISTVKKSGCKSLILLKCTSSYPSSPEDSNLLTIPDMRKRFNCSVGLSDHTLGIGVSLASISLGACLIEKHFTLSRKDGGVDSAFSMEPEEMKSLVIESKRAWQSLGKINYQPTIQEKKSMIFRRSIYVVQDMKKGEVFNRNNIRIIRPGYGLSPKYFEKLIGKPVKQSVKKGTPLSWNFVGQR